MTGACLEMKEPLRKRLHSVSIFILKCLLLRCQSELGHHRTQQSARFTVLVLDWISWGGALFCRDSCSTAMLLGGFGSAVEQLIC